MLGVLLGGLLCVDLGVGGGVSGGAGAAAAVAERTDAKTGHDADGGGALHLFAADGDAAGVAFVRLCGRARAGRLHLCYGMRSPKKASSLFRPDRAGTLRASSPGRWLGILRSEATFAQRIVWLWRVADGEQLVVRERLCVLTVAGGGKDAPGLCCAELVAGGP